MDKIIDKISHIKTSLNLYLRLENISEKINYPTFILTPNVSDASEFIITKKNSNVVIRLHSDMNNQNNTFGYHLYVIPENDLVYGSGNSETYAQFILELKDNYVTIKSAYKNTYLSHEFNILRNRPKNDQCNFIIENIHIPIVQRSICLITYGYMRKPIDLNSSPLINSLKSIYPHVMIDVYMFLPESMDEFYCVKIDNTHLTAPNCNVFVNTHQNDAKYFMKIAHSFGLPIVTSKNKCYSYRTISMIWNLSESVRKVLDMRKVYNTYILSRNDMFGCTKIFDKLLDTNNKLFCMNENALDAHLFIGKDIMKFNYLYDYYIKNKHMYPEELPEKIILDFLHFHAVKLGDIHHYTPFITYPSNTIKYMDSFYKNVNGKYQEIIGNII